MSRDVLIATIDELSFPLGYRPGEFLDAARRGLVPDTPSTSSLLALLPLAGRPPDKKNAGDG